MLRKLVTIFFVRSYGIFRITLASSRDCVSLCAKAFRHLLGANWRLRKTLHLTSVRPEPVQGLNAQLSTTMAAHVSFLRFSTNRIVALGSFNILVLKIPTQQLILAPKLLELGWFFRAS